MFNSIINEAQEKFNSGGKAEKVFAALLRLMTSPSNGGFRGFSRVFAARVWGTRLIRGFGRATTDRFQIRVSKPRSAQTRSIRLPNKPELTAERRPRCSAL